MTSTNSNMLFLLCVNRLVLFQQRCISPSTTTTYYFFCLIVDRVKMENVSKMFHESYLASDEDVMLIGDDFEMPIKLQVIKCFVPVMKTALETPLNEERNNQQTRKSIQVSGFDEDTVALFVKLFQQNDDKDMDLQWKEIVNLIKFSDYYQSETVLGISVAVGSKLISFESFFEAVEVMDGCNIDVWYKPCIDLLLKGKNLASLKADVRWKAAYLIILK